MNERDVLRMVKLNHHERRVRSDEVERLAKIGRTDAIADMQKQMDKLYQECLTIKRDFGIRQDHKTRIRIVNLNPARLLAQAEKLAAELTPEGVVARIDSEINRAMAEIARLRQVQMTPQVRAEIERWTRHVAGLQGNREAIIRG